MLYIGYNVLIPLLFMKCLNVMVCICITGTAPTLRQCRFYLHHSYLINEMWTAHLPFSLKGQWELGHWFQLNHGKIGSRFQLIVWEIGTPGNASWHFTWILKYVPILKRPLECLITWHHKTVQVEKVRIVFRKKSEQEYKRYDMTDMTLKDSLKIYG